jgi:hypothetical protein
MILMGKHIVGGVVDTVNLAAPRCVPDGYAYIPHNLNVERAAVGVYADE